MKTYCQWLTFRGILARISSFLSFVMFAMKRNYPYIPMIALIDIFILKEQHLKLFFRNSLIHCIFTIISIIKTSNANVWEHSNPLFWYNLMNYFSVQVNCGLIRNVDEDITKRLIILLKIIQDSIYKILDQYTGPILMSTRISSVYKYYTANWVPTIKYGHNF